MEAGAQHRIRRSRILATAVLSTLWPLAAPETRYAMSGDVRLAYQVLGEGSRDIVLLSSWDHAIDFHWDEPAQAQFLDDLSSLGRLILFDKRGTGASDSVSLERMPTLESWIDDIRCVMGAVGSERATIVAVTFTGPLACLFAATFPNLTSALVLIDTFAHVRLDPSEQQEDSTQRAAVGANVDPQMYALRDEVIDWIVDSAVEEWGVGQSLSNFYAPSLVGDERLRRWWNRCSRLSISPSAAGAFTRMMVESDVRGILSSIQAPTLVVYREHGYMRLASQYLARTIPGAHGVGLEGTDLLPWLDESLMDEIREFTIGVRKGPELSRALATVVLTDFVDSTRHAVAMGDRRWRGILDEYEVVADSLATIFMGHVVKSMGDGTLATFDGPARAVRFASALTEAVRKLGIELRCGVHTGEIEHRGDDIGGIGVHLAARVQAIASPGDVLVSRTVTDLVVGSGIVFEDRGTHVLKGVPGEWNLFCVIDA